MPLFNFLSMRKQLQWSVSSLACLLSLLMALMLVGQAQASTQCKAANPSSVSDVFECLATATINQYNNVNPFTNIEKSQCTQIKMMYASVLGAQGVPRDDIAEKLPTCKVLAQAVIELNGEPPIWYDCLDYDGTVGHMTGCLNGMIKASKGNPQALGNCMIARMTYETMLTSLSDDTEQPGKPEGYKEIDCDTYLASLKSVTDEVADNPCSGFSPSGINEHAKQCLLSEPRLTQSNAPLSCQSLRQTYQMKLIQVYGAVPAGFRLLACSIMNDIKADIESARAVK
ncbi:hypothetical protein PN836_009770 [Ningiella sp. W23]|uniref:hypothetical protein n=1 Tax=Ningiella sp. W23 TaxID=3023715 RepID=UPI003756A532